MCRSIAGWLGGPGLGHSYRNTDNFPPARFGLNAHSGNFIDHSPKSHLRPSGRPEFRWTTTLREVSSTSVTCRKCGWVVN